MIEKTADWTLSPISERELAEERRHRLARRRAGWLVYLSLHLLPSVFLTVYLPFYGYPSWIGYLSFGLPLAIFFEFLRRAKQNNFTRYQRQKGLREEYQNSRDGWIVGLTIYQGATATGRDQGLVWIEDGRLIFSGERTSFVLTPPDIVQARYGQASVEEIRSAITLRLSPLTVAGSLTIGFDVVPSAEKNGERILANLRFTIENFRIQPLARETQWPPLNIGPSLAPARMLLFRAAASTAFWLYLAYTCSMVLTRPAVLVSGLVTGAVVASLCPEVWLPHVRWRAYRDRLRLDHSLRQNKQQ